MQINALNLSSEYGSPVQQKTENFGDAKPQQPNGEVSEKPEKRVDQTENLTKLKAALAEHKITLKFSQDSQTNQLVVELVDERTGEAIRQMPSEVSLKLAADFVKLQGQFVDKTE